MTRNQAVVYVVGGLIVAALGFVISEPSRDDFKFWLAIPAILVVGGVVRLLRK